MFGGEAESKRIEQRRQSLGVRRVAFVVETLLIVDVGVDETREALEIATGVVLEELVGRGDVGETVGDGVEQSGVGEPARKLMNVGCSVNEFLDELDDFTKDRGLLIGQGRLPAPLAEQIDERIAKKREEVILCDRCQYFFLHMKKNRDGLHQER